MMDDILLNLGKGIESNKVTQGVELRLSPINIFSDSCSMHNRMLIESEDNDNWEVIKILTRQGKESKRNLIRFKFEEKRKGQGIAQGLK